MTRIDTVGAMHRALEQNMIGFDRLFDQLNRPNLDTVSKYPPYNMYKYDNDKYAIDMAVAGFTIDELDIGVSGDRLTIRGLSHRGPKEDAAREYIHRGLALREFSREFTLGTHIVVGEASLKDGVLRIELTHQSPGLTSNRIKISAT